MYCIECDIHSRAKKRKGGLPIHVSTNQEQACLADIVSYLQGKGSAVVFRVFAPDGPHARRAPMRR